MAKILITSGPTRQYLDPIRYLTNASSGRTGAALARAALDAGFEVVVVSGPVEIAYPKKAEIVPVVSTEEMLEACVRIFPECDGVIGVAAPCDYRPLHVAENKMSKADFTQKEKANGEFFLQLKETPDIMATLGKIKRKKFDQDALPLTKSENDSKTVSAGVQKELLRKSQPQWMVGFALETLDHRVRALQKLQRKCCDLIVLNDQNAMNGLTTSVEILDPLGNSVAQLKGTKIIVAFYIIELIKNRFSFND
ncbi:MAG: phosphopantothenoylcysteine decarboxylase [Planctomycetia bacterium]|nr:phosphopantothenoylcysteine decarboxylase [Planctomycetia bacterium]